MPDDVPAVLVERLAARGISRLYEHQAAAIELARAQRHVVVATGPASGKSLCYQLPIVERLLRDEHATALYLAPTKALGRDQLAGLRALRLPHVRAAVYDGDTPKAEREPIRRTANVVLTNPDMLHIGLLPHHRRWADFWHHLAVVVVDECHTARGVFGAHVAAILRRLRRIAAHYSADPTFVLASATIGNPAEHAANLTGLDVEAVTADASPRPPVVLGLWEPPLVDAATGARRSALAETADLLRATVSEGPLAGVEQTLAFVASRKGAELIAAATRDRLAGTGMVDAVAAYRAGLLGEERRAVEQGLADGRLRAVAATDALELGIDVGSLDAVIVCGWPGTAASWWQQAGRAGRRERPALVAFVADDNPLDHYLLAHPEALLDRPVEGAVADVTNPYVLAPHLRCAAYELPLDATDDVFGVDLRGLLAAEAADGRLRERGGRYYWSGRGAPAGDISIRSIGGEPYRIVDASTGALIGDADASRAFRTVHPGAVYLHQGTTWRIRDLDLDARTAVAVPHDDDTYTRPRTLTDIAVLRVTAHEQWGRVEWWFGDVEVATAVPAYETRRAFTEESLGVTELDLPTQTLDTRALWVTIPDAVLDDAGLDHEVVPGATHAAEHAAIGLLPLFALCDRWDIGGVSTARHADTGHATIFIYDGYPGGAGIAERGWRTGTEHLAATLAAIEACGCDVGCPSCVQSPKCGNGNHPLDKAAAVTLLAAILAEHAAAP